jgi:hypothetical protein
MPIVSREDVSTGDLLLRWLKPLMILTRGKGILLFFLFKSHVAFSEVTKKSPYDKVANLEERSPRVTMLH